MKEVQIGEKRIMNVLYPRTSGSQQNNIQGIKQKRATRIKEVLMALMNEYYSLTTMLLYRQIEQRMFI